MIYYLKSTIDLLAYIKYISLSDLFFIEIIIPLSIVRYTFCTQVRVSYIVNE